MFESSEDRFTARCGTADFLRILLMDYPFGCFQRQAKQRPQLPVLG
jgi:hypothetical protein